jgi:hypothetical protein
MTKALTTIAAGLVMLAACTAQPTAPAPATSGPTPVATAAAAGAAAAAATPTRTSDPKYAAFVRSARAQGYRQSRNDGKEIWCREESSIDWRVPRQSCITAPAVADAKAPADDAPDQTRKGE